MDTHHIAHAVRLTRRVGVCIAPRARAILFLVFAKEPHLHRIPSHTARLCLWSLLVLSAASAPAWALASVPSSPPPSWIHDGASLLTSSELSELATRKQQLEEQTGARLVVLTLAKADGESPKAIAVRTLNMWNAGRNSALLLVMMSPRELYIQPGTDLAPVFDAAAASSICASVVAPKMRSRDRAGALRAGLEAIASRIVSAADTPSASTAAAVPASQPSAPVAPLQQYGQSPEPRSSGSWAWLGWVAGLTGLGGGVWGFSRIFSKKCRECGTRMEKSSRTIDEPTTYSTGQGEHTYSCGACGYTFAEMYVISQIVESTSTTDSSSSSWSSSSSDSSWSSSSSDSSWSSSSSDSSSSSSSDSSGGGGSDW